MLDVIVPVLNEEEILTLKRDYYLWLKSRTRLIFVDGGSSDRTRALALEFGKVISSPKGRALQMNRGSLEGRNKYLLFLHADTFITREGLKQIEEAISKEICAGCFRLRINDQKIIFRVFEWCVNGRARYLKVFDGDLGLFIRRDIFEELGRFDCVPLMEDILFSKKLKKKDGLVIFDAPIDVSSRIWHEKGFLNTFWRYTQAYLHYWSNGLLISNHPSAI